MSQFGRPTRCTTREVVFVNDSTLETATCGIYGYTCSICTSSNDEQVIFCFGVLHFLDMLVSWLELEIDLSIHGRILNLGNVTGKLWCPQNFKLIWHWIAEQIVQIFNLLVHFFHYLLICLLVISAWRVDMTPKITKKRQISEISPGEETWTAST